VSDTKALYSLVADALAGHGREVQDAHAELLRRLEWAETSRGDAYKNGWDLIEESEELRERLERAEADNAALLKRIDAIGHSLGTYGNDVTTQELINSILRESHPGAALLEELEGLRTAIATLEKTVSIAYDAALEEAAETADGGPLYVRGVLMRPSERIRALKKTGQGQ